MSPVREAVNVTGRWYAVEAVGETVAPPTGDTFELGVTQPTTSNTGAGVIRPWPTAVVNGDVTVPAGTTYADRIINGRVTILGDGLLVNCLVRGAAAAPTGVAYLVTTSGATPTTVNTPATLVDPDAPDDWRLWTPNPAVPDNVQFCTLEPQTPSAWWNAFGSKYTRAYRCDIRRVVDGFRVYSNTTDGYVGTRIRGCLARDLSHFAPDYATGGRTRTHNDVVQAEGNTSPSSDFWIHGNAFDARHDPTVGTQPTVYEELAAIMLTANIDMNAAGLRAINVAITRNWLTGGVYTINAGKTVTAGGASRITWSENRHERPGSSTTRPGPTLAMGLDVNYARGDVTGNTYLDTGGPVPITNA